jgi:transcriptional regulator with XRE-family HTH domain
MEQGHVEFAEFDVTAANRMPQRLDPVTGGAPRGTRGRPARPLGKRLRELRTAARLSGRQLAESLSWPASKVSKIENGRQTPSDDDIRGWTATAHCEDQTEALLASLHSLEIQHAEWQRILRAGIRPRQNERSDPRPRAATGDSVPA